MIIFQPLNTFVTCKKYASSRLLSTWSNDENVIRVDIAEVLFSATNMVTNKHSSYWWVCILYKDCVLIDLSKPIKLRIICQIAPLQNILFQYLLLLLSYRDNCGDLGYKYLWPLICSVKRAKICVGFICEKCTNACLL